MITPQDLAYIAGFMDGDGCISVIKGGSAKYKSFYYTARIMVVNRDPAPIEFINKLFPAKIYITKGRKPQHGITYRYCITNYQDMKTFCDAIIPYLISKKRQAKLLSRYIGSRLEQLKKADHRNFNQSTRITIKQEEMLKQIKELVKDHSNRGTPFIPNATR
jgi:hypothetical protein